MNQKPQGPTDEIVNSPRKRDKCVHVKKYLAHKLEPGDNERALSRVLSDALSPKKSSGDTGMMEKMPGVVTSFLRDEGPMSKINMTNSSTAIHLPVSLKLSPQSSTSSVSINLSPLAPVCGSANSSPLIPVSTNPHEVVAEEENHVRVLQAN